MVIDVYHSFGAPEHYYAIKDKISGEYLVGVALAVKAVLINPSRSSWRKLALCAKGIKQLFLNKPIAQAAVLGVHPATPWLALGVLIAKSKYISVVYHSSFNAKDERFYLIPIIRLNLWLIRSMGVLVACVSMGSVEYFSRYGCKTSFVGHSINFEAFTRGDLKVRKQPRFAYVGRDVPYKNIDLIISLFETLEYPLDLIGNIERRKPNLPNLNYLGHRSRFWLEKNLCSYDFLLVASDEREPFGLVYLEAVAANVIVLSSPTVGYKSIFGDLTNMLLFPRTADELEARVKLFQLSTDEISKLYAQVRQKFSKTSIAVVWSQILHENKDEA